MKVFYFWEGREIVMIAVSVEQAQEKLVEIIDTLKPGEEVEIRRGNQAVAKLVGQKRQRQFGLGKGRLKIVREDDAYLEDFREYMP